MTTATQANPTLQARLEAARHSAVSAIPKPTSGRSPSSCFDMARHMTGQTMAVDGGRYLGL